ncbi:hypothetical protein [Nocardiopsis deserti]|uniref:hypothetical protein n=1 Tax=Nocardiopsis deserti TaxID=2605988 RepID=UPI001CC24B4C|nr:hypothetical protein [Nocardiopsis deserti]
MSTAEKAVKKVLDSLDLRSSTDEWEDRAPLVHRVLELAKSGIATEEEWREDLDAVLTFAAHQDSQYVSRGKDEFDVVLALTVARATGLGKGSTAKAKPAGNGRPEGWVPRLGQTRTKRSRRAP